MLPQVAIDWNVINTRGKALDEKMSEKKRNRFTHLIQLWGIIFLTGISASIVAIDIIGTYHDVNFRADQMRTDHIDRQKQIIKHEVNRVVDMILYEKAQSEILTRKKIKSRVYEAYSIAQNIHEQNQAATSAAEIQKMILARMIFGRELTG